MRRQVGGDARQPAATPPYARSEAATTTIPIVFTTGSDVVGAGFVTKLNRPAGRMLTGVSPIWGGAWTPKRLGNCCPSVFRRPPTSRCLSIRKKKPEHASASRCRGDTGSGAPPPGWETIVGSPSPATENEDRNSLGDRLSQHRESLRPLSSHVTDGCRREQIATLGSAAICFT